MNYNDEAENLIKTVRSLNPSLHLPLSVNTTYNAISQKEKQDFSEEKQNSDHLL